LEAKPERKILLGRSRNRFEDNIKMDGCGMDWNNLAQDKKQ
jgi:hypothetical protein